MTIGTLVLLLLVAILIGVLPTWPHSRAWGYCPSGLVGVFVAVMLAMRASGSL
ncbi:MAG TPA: DUF3309 family protein [Steroidobacteraceae bacterium]